MISIRKLNSLPPKTRLRKIVLLLQAEELELSRGRPAHGEYLDGICRLLAEEQRCGQGVRSAAARCSRLCRCGEAKDPQSLHRRVNALRHALLRDLGAEPAEWDLVNPAATGLDESARTVLPIRLYLEELRSPFNVGAIFRCAEAFGVQELLLSPSTASPLHPRSLKSARGAVGIMPWRYAELQELEEPEGIFALELGGTPLHSFAFPDRGVMLIGSEELGLSPQSLQLAAREAGRVSIPMIGAKRSLNVSVAVGIVLQTWQERIMDRQT